MRLLYGFSILSQNFFKKRTDYGKNEFKTLTPVAVTLERDLSGPADISVADGKIYIPDLPASRVVF